MASTRPTIVRRRSARPASGCLLLLILVCITSAAGIWAYLALQNEVVSVFGQPAAGINPLSRVYYSLRLFTGRDRLLTPLDPGGSDIVFDIGQGESVGSVAYRLETAGLIADSESFRLYLVYSGQDRLLQAGKFKISPGKTPLEIAKQLQDSTPAEVVFVILPGWRLEEVAASLPSSGLQIDPQQFLQGAMRPVDEYLTTVAAPDASSLEGFLLPGEYLLPRQAVVDQVLAVAINAFHASVSMEISAGLQAQGLNLFEAVTLASIVERESILAEEQPMIASVFLNRLAAGMKLDSDPTVQYAVGYNQSQQSWWTNPLSAADLQFDSPYNTYLYHGLPPGPIANPGLSALRAVAFPASSPYYYFRAKCDGSGSHSFAVTFEEHVQNACELLR